MTALSGDGFAYPRDIDEAYLAHAEAMGLHCNLDRSTGSSLLQSAS